MAKQKDDKVTKNEVESQRQLNDELVKSRDLIRDIVTSQNESLKTYADKMDLTSQLNENAKILSTLNLSIDKLSASQSDRAQMLVTQYTTQRDLLSDVQSKYVDILQNSNKISDTNFESIDLSKEQAKLLDARLELEEKRDVLKEGEYEKEKDILDIIKEKLDLADKMNQSQLRANELAKKFLDNTTLVGHANQKLLGGMENIIDEVGTGGLGIIGSFLGKKASSLLEQTRESIEEKVVKAFQESGESAVNAFSLARMSFGSFISYALPALGIAGLLGAFGLLIHTLSHLDAELSEIGKEFGVTRKEADKLHHVTIDIANEMNVVGIRSKQVLEAVKDASDALGGLDFLSRFKQGSEGAVRLVKDFAILKNEFGLGTDELSGIQDFATASGKSIGQVVKETTKLGKGLFTSKQAIGIIAKISPTIALSFRKGSQELIKAAQKAKLLGMELDDVQKFGDNILDIETSIQAEMEARALTGKNINLDTARYYALTNNVAGLQEELLRNIGSSAEFSKMNRIQQQALATAFGMQIDDVAKLLIAQEKLVELGIDQTKLSDIQQMNAEQLADELKNTNNVKLKGYLETLKREKESASINERIENIVTKIKEKIAATVAPLLEMAHKFFESAEGAEFLDKTINGVKSLIQLMIPVVKFLAENIWLVVGALTAIAAAKIIGGIGSIVQGFRSMSGAIKETSDAAGAISNSSGSISNATSAMSSLSAAAQNTIAASVLLVAFAGALYITAKAFQEFGKVNWNNAWPGIGIMIALAGAAWALAASVKGMAIAAAGVGLLSVALLSFGGAVLMIGYGAKMFSESISVLADGIKKFTSIGNIESVAENISKIVESVGSISDVISPIKTIKVKNALQNLGIEEIAKFGDLAKLDLKKAGQNIVEGINSLVNLNDKIDWGTGAGMYGMGKRSGIIGTFESLNQAIRGLNLESVQALAEIAKTEMKNLGNNLQQGINSLKNIDVSGSVETLESVEDVFSALYDALMLEGMGEGGAFGSYESYLNPLKDLASFDISKVLEVTSKLKDVIYNLADIGNMTKLVGGMSITTGLDNLKNVIDKLSLALENLDVSKLQSLADVDAENLRKLSSVFQQPVTVGGGRTSEGAPAQGTNQTISSNEAVVTNKKLDEAIGLLRQILTATNQPTVIKIGDRTIEQIGTQLGFKNSYSIAIDKGPGRLQ